MSCDSSLPERMKCVQFNKHSSDFDNSDFSTTTLCPTKESLNPDEAIIKVQAASVNPIDVRMLGGYGSTLFGFMRKFGKENDLPLIVGHDCSGIVVERGEDFRQFEIGDAVSCVTKITKQGSHAEYVVVNKEEVSAKPENLSHVETASMLYVAGTTWSALISSNVVPLEGSSKKIFIPGGSGGVGSFAVQLCQVLGHDVTTTCATDAVEMLNALGIQNIIDYRSESYEEDLRNAGPFDVIYDTLGEKHIEFFRELIKPNASSSYVSLQSTLLSNMDYYGVFLGGLLAGKDLISRNLKHKWAGKGSYSWGFFKASGSVLDQLRPFFESGQIKPVVDKVYSLDNALDAYKHVQLGHARGKTVLDMSL